MAIMHAKSVQIHWEQKPNDPSGIAEASVEVEFPNGDRQYLMVQVLRSSQKFKPTQQNKPLGFINDYSEEVKE